LGTKKKLIANVSCDSHAAMQFVQLFHRPSISFINCSHLTLQYSLDQTSLKTRRYHCSGQEQPVLKRFK